MKLITSLTSEFSLDTFCIIAKELLEDDVFASETQARLHFPELFETSKRQLAERQLSEGLAARSEAEAMEEIMALSDMDENISPPEDWNKTSREGVQQGEGSALYRRLV